MLGVCSYRNWRTRRSHGWLPSMMLQPGVSGFFFRNNVSNLISWKYANLVTDMTRIQTIREVRHLRWLTHQRRCLAGGWTPKKSHPKLFMDWKRLTFWIVKGHVWNNIAFVRVSSQATVRMSWVALAHVGLGYEGSTLRAARRFSLFHAWLIGLRARVCLTPFFSV